MARETNPGADALLDIQLPCLNHGFVRLVDYMGGDNRVVQAARVSYGSGTKSVREDVGLINYLMKNWHTSPFEQVHLTFHCKMPIFVARQWVRHRTARLNEISGRYSVMKDEFYIPALEDVCYQNKDNKQGRSGSLPTEEAQAVVTQMQADQRTLYGNYESLLDEDPTKSVARELARVNLPLSLYTEWYWECDLHNIFHFLRLRLDGHAQKEIRVYGEAMAQCVRAVAPICWAAFEEHQLNAVSFSGTEILLLREMLEHPQIQGRQDVLVERLGSTRNVEAFLSKLRTS